MTYWRHFRRCCPLGGDRFYSLLPFVSFVCFVGGVKT
jgi:hypothetical protein